jgi:hypothetical protein
MSYNILLWGRTRSGKSLYTKMKILRELERLKKPAIIIDPQNEYDRYKRTTKKNFIEDLKKYGIIRYIPKGKTVKERIEDADELYTMIYENIRNCHIIIDEAPKVGGMQHQLSCGLDMLVTGGLKWGLRCVLITQRLQMIDKTLSGNCTCKIIFKVEDDIDWKRVKDYKEEVWRFLKFEAKGKLPYCIVKDGEVVKKCHCLLEELRTMGLIK